MLVGREDSVHQWIHHLLFHISHDSSSPYLRLWSFQKGRRHIQLWRHEIAQQMNTAVKVGEADVPPMNTPYNIWVMCGLLLTKMPLETLAFCLVARGHYSGAIVQAQEVGVTLSQLVCIFPSQRGISWEVRGIRLITSAAWPHSRGWEFHTPG